MTRSDPATRRARTFNPSARRWRAVALIGMPIVFVIGVGVGASASPPRAVPAPGPTTGATGSSERPVRRLATPAASPSATPAILGPLAGVGSDGAAEISEYYSNCKAARRAGVTPIFDDEPGYRSGLDRDNDGVACE